MAVWFLHQYLYLYLQQAIRMEDNKTTTFFFIFSFNNRMFRSRFQCVGLLHGCVYSSAFAIVHRFYLPLQTKKTENIFSSHPIPEPFIRSLARTRSALRALCVSL